MAGYVSGNMLDLLHWLPFRQRIIFRIASLVRQCCLSLAPASLRELCCLTPDTICRSIPAPRNPCPLHPYVHKVKPCLLCVGGLSLALRLLTRHSILAFKVKTVLFSRDGVGVLPNGSPQEVLHKS